MIHIILYGVVLPLLLSTFVVSGWWRAWSPGRPALAGAGAAFPLMLAVAWGVGAVGILSGLRLPPVTGNERLVVAGVVVSLVALVPARLLGRKGSALATGLMGAGVVAAVLWSRLSSWGVAGVGGTALVGGLLTAGIAAGAAQLGERRGGWASAAFLTALLTLVAAVVGLSGSAKLGQLTGILAAFTGPMLVLGWIRGDFRLEMLSVGALVAIGAGLLAAGSAFGELGVLAMVLVALVGLGSWAGWLLRERSVLLELGLMAGIGVTLGLAAVGWTVLTGPPLVEDSPAGYTP